MCIPRQAEPDDPASIKKQTFDGDAPMSDDSDDRRDAKYKEGKDFKWVSTPGTNVKTRHFYSKTEKASLREKSAPSQASPSAQKVVKQKVAAPSASPRPQPKAAPKLSGASRSVAGKANKPKLSGASRSVAGKGDYSKVKPQANVSKGDAKSAPNRVTPTKPSAPKRDRAAKSETTRNAEIQQMTRRLAASLPSRPKTATPKTVAQVAETAKKAIAKASAKERSDRHAAYLARAKVRLFTYATAIRPSKKGR